MRPTRTTARPTRTTAVIMVAVVSVLATAATALAAPTPVEPGAHPIEAFEPSTGCGCHAQLLEEYSESMHHKAITDPAYLYKREEAAKATGGKIVAYCDKCHAPVADMAKETLDNLSPVSAEGVTCTFCHQLVGTRKPIANVSQLVDPGPRRAQIKDPQAPHPAAYSEFHEQAEICGGCHNVDHPVNGMHLESTYTEWLASPYAKEGIVCQNCHMGRSAGPDAAPFTGQAAGGAPQRDNIFAMTFAGANVAQGNPVLAEAQLKAAADIKLEIPEVVKPGPASGTVTIRNVGAGHYLPTGLTEVRQMWLEVTAQVGDEAPKVIAERRFGTILRDAKGNAPVELWDAVAFESDDRIPPKGSTTTSFTVDVPDENAEVLVTAELKYASLPDEFAKAAKVDNPVTIMASEDSRIFGSEAAKNAAARPDSSSGGSTSLVVVIAGLVIVAAVVAGVVLRGRSAKR